MKPSHITVPACGSATCNEAFALPRTDPQSPSPIAIGTLLRAKRTRSAQGRLDGSFLSRASTYWSAMELRHCSSQSPARGAGGAQGGVGAAVAHGLCMKYGT